MDSLSMPDIVKTVAENNILINIIWNYGSGNVVVTR